MPNITKVEVSSGAVLHCRSVPPFATAEVRMRLPEPPLPKVTVASAAGGPEEHPALPGTPEYDEWVRKQQAHRRELGLALERFSFNFGVVGWEWPNDKSPHATGELGESDLVTKPPEDWRLPEIMRDYGVKELVGPDRRAQYILYELVLTDADTDKVASVIMRTEELTRGEVVAALAPFDSTAKEGPSSTQPPPQQE